MLIMQPSLCERGPRRQPLGELTAIGGGDGDLGLERDAGGDFRQRLKRGRCVHPSSGRASGVPLRGDCGFGNRNDDLIGSRGGLPRVGGAHDGSPHVERGQAIAEVGRSSLSGRAKTLPIPAIRAVSRPAQGLDESRRALRAA